MTASPHELHEPHQVDQGAANLPAALLVLTAVTGLVDAVSVLGFGVFTANMTGNVVFLGFAVAGTRGFSIARSVTSLAAFLAGAAIGGRIGVAMDATRRRWLLTVAVCEATLLFVAALASIGLEIGRTMPPSRLSLVIVLLAVAMGLRNATVRRLAVPDLTTTVLTLTLTGLAADSSLAGGANPRIGRRAASVLLMFAGAAIGSLLLRLGFALPLVLSGVCVLAVTAIYLAIPASRPSGTPLGGKAEPVKEK
ncbi:MAG: YoaK family protein [Blastocatellia bacterium]